MPIGSLSWNQHAQAVIDAALQDFNPNATEKELREHLRRHYPYGERKYHPYKQWLQAVNKAVRRRCVGVTAPERGPIITIEFKSGIRLGVQCDWCGQRNRRATGCMVCGELFCAAKIINENPTFHSLSQAFADGDDTAAAMAADWLRDHGHESLGQLVDDHIRETNTKARKGKPCVANNLNP